jgi:hypothetical protein
MAALITIPSSNTVKATLDRLDRARPASDGAADLRQCGRRHAADAGGPDDRHRSAAQGAGLGGRVGSGAAVVQRWLAQRHGLDAASAVTTHAMSTMLAIIAQKAAAAVARSSLVMSRRRIS